MNLTCEELVELILEFVEGELAVEHRIAFEQHLVGCRHCVTTIETYRVTVTLTRALPRCEAPLSAQFEARLRAALDGEPRCAE